MLLDSMLDHTHSRFWEFDARLRPYKVPTMSEKIRKHIYLPKEVIRGAEAKGVSLGDYIAHLHHKAGSVRVAHVCSIYRSFALLEMARVPVEPAYFDLVEGVLGEVDGKRFRGTVQSGEPYALPRAASALLGDDIRTEAVKAIFMAAARASVMHEGYIEAARLLESTLIR